MWKSLYDPNINVYETIEKFFHRDYEQCVNGIVSNRNQFTHVVIEQRENMVIDYFEYKYVIEQGDELFMLYYPKGRTKNNLPIEAEVIVYCCLSNQQIIRMHGQFRLIKEDNTTKE